MKRAAITVACAILFFSLARTTLPQLVELTREALRLRPLSYKQRRASVIGTFYDSVVRLQHAIPKNEPLAIILKRDRDIDGAVMLDYYFYPRSTRIYPSLAAYRTATDHPQRIVYFDSQRSGEPRLMTYVEIRAEQLPADFVSEDMRAAGPASRSFVVPVVASLDGPRDTYTTEAVIENAANRPAHATLELFPSRRRVEVVVPPSGRLSWNDFVGQVFGSLEYGWLRVSADQPLRSRFHFVNRTLRSSAEIPVLPAVDARSIDLNAPAGSRLWIVNVTETDVEVRVNGQAAHRVPPFAVRDYPASPTMRVESDFPLFAFASWRDDEGGSRFVWPEKR